MPSQNHNELMTVSFYNLKLPMGEGSKIVMSFYMERYFCGDIFDVKWRDMKIETCQTHVNMTNITNSKITIFVRYFERLLET